MNNIDEISTDMLVKAYTTLRDNIKIKTDALEKEIAPMQEALDTIENALTAKLHEIGDTDEGNRHIKTPYGTVFREKWTSAKVEDHESWLEFVFNIDGRHFLTKHVSKEAITTWMEEHNGSLPPGIKFDAGWKTKVRKS